jgi:hypothetical protein
MCPLCNSLTHNSPKPLRGVISPWIRELTGINKRLSKLNFCSNCFGAFFDYRYNEFEMKKIYENYRGDIYTETRKAWEPWYSQKYNSNHESTEYLEARRKGLENFLIENRVGNLDTAIDIGGGSGSLIPEFQGSTKK